MFSSSLLAQWFTKLCAHILGLPPIGCQFRCTVSFIFGNANFRLSIKFRIQIESIFGMWGDFVLLCLDLWMKQWSCGVRWLRCLFLAEVLRFLSFHPFLRILIWIWIIVIDRKSENGNEQGNQGNLSIKFDNHNGQWGLSSFLLSNELNKWIRTHSLSYLAIEMSLASHLVNKDNLTYAWKPPHWLWFIRSPTFFPCHCSSSNGKYSNWIARYFQNRLSRSEVN